MKVSIKHEMRGRIRIHLQQKKMTSEQADILEYYFSKEKAVTSVKVYEKTADVVICYEGSRSYIFGLLKKFRYEEVSVPDSFLKSSGREMNRQYKEKLVNRVILRAGSRLFLPYQVRAGIAIVKSVKYVWNGIRTLVKGKIEVPVLDAAAIGVSIIRKDYDTASSVMFLLGIGEILEEWTHKKSIDDLARSMSLNVSKVWLKQEDNTVLVPVSDIREGDHVVVHMGNVIPFDGVVSEGEAMVNQASLTGESLAVKKEKDKYVYAGTVLEEGEITFIVKKTEGASRYEKIVTMIEESEKLKSNLEGRAGHLADRLVPYTLAGAGLMWLFTKNPTKALSVLMVDFSCALKLAMPIAVLSAIREAGQHHVTVKGGKFLEAVAEADTVVLDKTGTLTKAQPVVAEVISFNGASEDELLRIAACLEEHFPHSLAKAVVDAAKAKELEHEEFHSKVEYIVAHGISTMVDGKKTIIGSYHFVFEDEACVIPEGMEERFKAIPPEYSQLFLAIEQKLAAVICIEDPLREEAKEIVKKLKKAGIKKVVMMTGDSERTAKVIAEAVGVDEYFSEVLPEDKVKFVEQEQAEGRKVIMLGDGVNDSPALSAADAGIAISDGAEIAREIADITIDAEDLQEIVTLKLISNALMKRIRKNYRVIVGFNLGLIACGVAGVLPPTASALLHNTSTLLISLSSMRDFVS